MTVPSSTRPSTQPAKALWARWPAQVDLVAYVGTDKAGSTWLHSRMASVPGASVSPAKDIYFFDTNYSRGVGWYLDQFPVDSDTRTVFDISHDYMYSNAALERLRACPVLTQVLVSLREPSDRAISAYYYAAAYQRLPLDFWSAVDRIPKIVENSFYSQRLASLQDALGGERMTVQAFEQLKTEPVEFLNGFATVSGLSAMHAQHVDASKSRASREARSTAMSALAKQGARLARRAGSPALVGRVKSSRAVESLLFRDRQTTLENEAELRIELAEFFAQDRERTLAMFPDLGRWWAGGAP